MYGQRDVKNTQYASFFAGAITKPYSGMVTQVQTINNIIPANAALQQWGGAFGFNDDGTVAAGGAQKSISQFAGILVNPNGQPNYQSDLSASPLVANYAVGTEFMTNGFCAALVIFAVAGATAGQLVWDPATGLLNYVALSQTAGIVLLGRVVNLQNYVIGVTAVVAEIKLGAN